MMTYTSYLMDATDLLLQGIYDETWLGFSVEDPIAFVIEHRLVDLLDHLHDFLPEDDPVRIAWEDIIVEE